ASGTAERSEQRAERGRRGVGVSHRTGDAGEPTQGTLPREGDTGTTELLEGKMTEPLTSGSISTKLERIAKLAKEAPEMAFRSLAHHIDVDWQREAHRRTRKDGATGVDRQTAEEYATNLESNLQSLHDRAKSGT